MGNIYLLPTLLSQHPAAKKSATGEKLSEEMPSVGGCVTSMSCSAGAAAGCAGLPNVLTWLAPPKSDMICLLLVRT
jgi:hypothetical protein